jgi:small-conductance mechanosensitive channel
MFHKSVSEKQEYRNNNIRISGSKVKQGFKDIIAAKRELQEIKESIDAARDRLNKMVSQDERLQLTTEEIIEVSRQLDILIQDYNRKSVEIQEITEINNYASD